MKEYICPHCEEKQTSFTQWQTISVAHEFDLEKKEWIFDVDSGDSADHESFVCPSCDEALDEKFSEDFINELS